MQSRSPFWQKIELFLALLSNSMRMLAGLALCATAFMTCAGIAFRMAGMPLFGTEELAAFLAAIIMAFSLPYAHRERSHIAVDMFLRVFSRKERFCIFVLTDALAAGIFALLSWQLYRYADVIRQSGERSLNLGWQEHYVVLLVAFGVVVFAMHLVRDFLERVICRNSEDC